MDRPTQSRLDEEAGKEKGKKKRTKNSRIESHESSKVHVSLSYMHAYETVPTEKKRPQNPVSLFFARKEKEIEIAFSSVSRIPAVVKYVRRKRKKPHDSEQQ